MLHLETMVLQNSALVNHFCDDGHVVRPGEADREPPKGASRPLLATLLQLGPCALQHQNAHQDQGYAGDLANLERLFVD